MVEDEVTTTWMHFTMWREWRYLLKHSPYLSTTT
jgi:hypothetical protein